MDARVDARLIHHGQVFAEEVELDHVRVRIGLAIALDEGVSNANGAALTTRARVQGFRDLGTKVGDAVAELLDFFERFDEAKYGTDGGPLHDPTVIAWLISPKIFGGRDVNVEIETGSELTMGQTVIDWWGVTDRPRNVHVVREVDSDAFFGLLLERIGRL